MFAVVGVCRSRCGLRRFAAFRGVRLPTLPPVELVCRLRLRKSKPGTQCWSRESDHILVPSIGDADRSCAEEKIARQRERGVRGTSLASNFDLEAVADRPAQRVGGWAS